MNLKTADRFSCGRTPPGVRQTPGANRPGCDHMKGGLLLPRKEHRMKSALYPAMRIVALASERTSNLRALMALDWLAGVLLRWHTRGV